MTSAVSNQSAGPGGRLSGWTGDVFEIPALTVHELFERAVRATGTGDGTGPETVAVVHGTRTVTYGELDRQADRVRDGLLDAGVASGDAVGLCLRRSPELFAAMLGVLKAGACYLPMDSADPDERLRHVVDQAGGIGAYVVDGSRDLPVGTARVLVLDEPWRAAAGEEGGGGGGGGRAVGQDAAAYVLHTSGSTGRPKSVALTHRSLVNMLLWHDRTRPGTCRSRTAQVCTASFDFSFHEIFSTLCFGGTLVVADDEVRRNPVALAGFLSEQHIERLFAPVTVLKQLAEAAAGGTAPLVLADVVTTGERLRVTPAMAELFGRSGARLHNHYGATEFQDAATHTLSGDPGSWPASVPIGRPIDNVRVYLLDAELRQVPVGAEGEVCVAGAGVARGYLGSPELTAERFVPDPYGDGLLYRTGDLGRATADGTIECLGRMDDQIKIQGMRVEPGEIEALLSARPDVHEAAVLAHELDGHPRLVAYLVLRKKARRDGATRRLHRHLAGLLPPYMMPDAYVVLDAMPLTPSGKTDRRRLTPPAVFERLQDAGPARPGSPTEQLVIEVWQDVLRLDSVGAEDNFFEIGGTSLHAVEVQDLLAGQLGLSVSAADIFRQQTVRELAAQLDRARTGTGHG
ncbi:amino acid adenylation domain-containing protein [Streptomyces sp. 3211.6]|uniref:non-ribosomal peptide synthetase n=1 Tax=Streptomyces TaxID=1883 RepID=UPI0009A505E4|nr:MULTISPECIES: non-ribosomal peptide synthetase [Streptomyces]RKT08300.1 amino acid adenylation domain-containing protein [Streptomyces sp. 3211.6]RPF29700.1 amino acid adenylation domain-containing protein [Streptomyces sp. Ag109_G2-6]